MDGTSSGNQNQTAEGNQWKGNCPLGEFVAE